MLIYASQQKTWITTKDTQIVKTTEETKTIWHVRPTLMWLLTAGFLN